MIFDRIAERKLRDAISQGELDDLPNAGRPLDLEDYFRTPADLRVAYSILKNARCVPEEIQLLNEIETLDQTLAGGTSDAVVVRNRMRDCRLRLAVLLERNRRRPL